MSSKRRLQDHRPDDPDPGEITLVVTTFKQRDQWSRKTARDPRVKLMHRHVLRSLALCARADSGGMLVIDPTYADLAKAARCHRATVIRAVAVAEEIGIIRKVRQSDGRVSNTFELLLPQAGSYSSKSRVPTVANSEGGEGPNGCKFPVPTVANIPDAESSNGRTAATVLRGESKKELEERPFKTTGIESDHTHSLDRPMLEPRAREPLTPVPRADARTDVVSQKQPAPSLASKIDMGRPGDSARAAFADVSYAWPSDRTDDEGYAAYLAALAAAQGDTDIVFDAVEELLWKSGADPPWLSDALRRIEHELRIRQARSPDRQ